MDELARLDRSDVKIENDILQLFIELSKTDQYRVGAWVVLAASGKVTCPVTIMSRYLEKAELCFASPLFCQLSKTKFGYKKRAKGLSCTRLRELVFEAFKDGAYYCYCAYVLCISRYSGFLWVVPTNTRIFLRGLKLYGESRT